MLFLLTFFIYSVMVTERVDLVPMELRTYRSGQAAKPAPAATISIDLEGLLYLDRLPVALDELVSKLEPLRTASPDLVVYLALASGSSKVDRSDLLLEVWDRLQPAKFSVSIVGRRNDGPEIKPTLETGTATPTRASLGETPTAAAPASPTNTPAIPDPARP